MKLNRYLIILFTGILFCMPLLINGQTSFGKAKLINDSWLFKLIDEPGASEVNFKDNGWRRLDLPHDWSIEGELSPTLASCTGYLPGGIGWYRKKLDIPVDLRERTYFCISRVFTIAARFILTVTCWVSVQMDMFRLHMI